jgi:hypothetical protein
MIERISQSFIKDFKAYQAGDECGVIIKAKYIDDRLLDSDEPGAKELGTYVEFMISGAVPKNGIVPKAVMMPSNPKKPIASYRLGQVNATRVKEYFQRMGLKIFKANVRLMKGRYSAALDLIVEFVGVTTGPNGALQDLDFGNGLVWHIGDHMVIDIKNSGLVGDKTPLYNKLGWRWSKVQKEYHGTQAKQYHFVSGLPFYFLVIQSNNDEDTLSEIQIFHVPVEPFMIEDHVNEGNALFDQFNAMAKTNLGWKPRPSLKRCQKCPLNIECKFKHTFPHPQVVTLNTEE